MKCHYEILGIERDALDPDIKKSYRKLALQWHPDKNPDRLEECTKTFHLIQQAYEVLIDPQERAWYDKHREAILRGGMGKGDDYQDDSVDVFQYFTATCYSGFNDEQKGFYTVYRKVFESIAAEDHEFMDSTDSDFDFPAFGDSLSEYEDVVGQFYGYWESYCTARSYVWSEKYDTRSAPNRQLRRAMEQYNKKLRDKAKKERNEEVRELVAFVKKRDERVQAYKKKLGERAVEIARMTEERKLQQKQERLKKFENFRESGWSATHGLEKDLEALEADLSKQFGDDEYCSDDEEETKTGDDEDQTDEGEMDVFGDLYCIACNRAFKTDKAFVNHENSKKHKENVAILKVEMVDEDLEELSVEDEEDLNEHVLYDDLYCIACDKAFDTEHALSSHVQSKKHRDTIAKLTGDYVEESDDSRVPDLHTSQSCEDFAENKSKLSKKQKKRRRRKLGAEAEAQEDAVSPDQKQSQSDEAQQSTNEVQPEIVENSDQTEAIAEGIDAHKSESVNSDPDKQRQTSVKSTKKNAGGSKNEDWNEAMSQDPFLCNTCGQEYSTRNKMHQHLKATNHALRLEPGAEPLFKQDSKSKKKKKGKR